MKVAASGKLAPAPEDAPVRASPWRFFLLLTFLFTKEELAELKLLEQWTTRRKLEQVGHLEFYLRLLEVEKRDCKLPQRMHARQSD